MHQQRKKTISNISQSVI